MDVEIFLETRIPNEVLVVHWFAPYYEYNQHKRYYVINSSHGIYARIGLVCLCRILWKMYNKTFEKQLEYYHYKCSRHRRVLLNFLRFAYIFGEILVSVLSRSHTEIQINHLLYVNNIKLARDNYEVAEQLRFVKGVGDDIRMEFGLDKCARTTFTKRKLEKRMQYSRTKQQ